MKVWGRGIITPLIPNLSTRCECLARFPDWSVLQEGRPSSNNQWTNVCVGPTGNMGALKERWVLTPLAVEQGTLGHPARTSVGTPTTLTWLQNYSFFATKFGIHVRYKHSHILLGEPKELFIFVSFPSKVERILTIWRLMATIWVVPHS